MRRLLALYRYSLQYPGEGGPGHAVRVYGARALVLLGITGASFLLVTVLALIIRRS
jgi:hypothetical protein